MPEKKGDIYFKDYNDNFYKLDTSSLHKELKDINNFDNVVECINYIKINSNYKNYKYYKMILKNIKNGLVEDNRISLTNGIYKFSIFLSLETDIEQRIYFFFKNKEINPISLKTEKIYGNIPNNLSFNFIINTNNQDFEIAIISQTDLNNILLYVLYDKISN